MFKIGYQVPAGRCSVESWNSLLVPKEAQDRFEVARLVAIRRVELGEVDWLYASVRDISDERFAGEGHRVAAVLSERWTAETSSTEPPPSSSMSEMR